jgi:hypothetical protein
VDEVLMQALEPVLRDIASTGAPMPLIQDDWDGPEAASAMLWSANGSGSGVTLAVSDSEEDCVAWVTNQVQEWVIEEMWAEGLPTNWPMCPTHPVTHPLTAIARPGAAGWVCPQDQRVIAPVGSLRSEHQARGVK